MSFFLESIGFVSSVIGIYDPIVEKLEDPKKEFDKKIRKTVKATVKLFQKNLSGSDEFKSVIPSDATDIITENIYDAIKKDLPVTIDIICPEDTIPGHIREQLYHAIFTTLKYTIEFSFRDFEVWTKQSYKETIYYLNKILNFQEHIEQVITSIIDKSSTVYDSAQEHSSRIFKSKNKFHYTSNMTRFYGREKELEKLKEFCICESDDSVMW